MWPNIQLFNPFAKTVMITAGSCLRWHKRLLFGCPNSLAQTKGPQTDNAINGPLHLPLSLSMPGQRLSLGAGRRLSIIAAMRAWIESGTRATFHV